MSSKKNTNNRKTIMIDSLTHKELMKLSDEHNNSIKGFVEDSIIYFKKTGINPKDLKNESASILIKTIDRRIVSFFKTQEKNILMPILDRTIENNEKFDKLIENLNHIFQKISENEKYQQESLQGIIQSLNHLQSKP